MITYEEIVGFWEDKEPDCKDWFEELCSVREEIVPFIGAGMSRNVNGSAYPLWKEFLEEIGKKELLPEEYAELSELIGKNSYERAAGFLEQKLGKVLFRDNVKRIFKESRLENIVFPEKIMLLTELFKGNIVTTNIDKTIEIAFKNLQDINIPILIPQLQLDMANKNIGTNTHCLIKIHGDVNEATSWVLTNEQYDFVYGNELRQDLSFVSFLKRLMISRKLLFIGCGLEKDRTYDVLNDIIQHNNTYRHFALIEYPDDNESRIMKKRYLINSLNIYPIWFPHRCFESIEILLRRMLLYHGTHTDVQYVNKKINNVYKGAIYFIDQFFIEKHSHVDNKLSWAFASVSGEMEVIAHAVCCGEAFINQDAFHAAKSFISGNNDMPFFITGAGGQGKTVLMMELARYFSQQNFPVFWIPIGKQVVSAESVRELFEILNNVSSIYGRKTLLMMDNPYANLDCLEIFYHELIYGSYNIQVIVSERISRLDYIFSDDEYRFASWSQGGYFLCLGKQAEFEKFQWMQMYQIVPFHTKWKHTIIKSMCSKLVEYQGGEASAVESILQMQEKSLKNTNISLVESIYRFILDYNEKIGASSGMHIVSKRIPMDWDDWENWLQKRNIQDASSYAYIAALYLLKIPVSVETLAQILDVPKHKFESELDNSLRNGYKEPVIYDYDNETISIKHDVIAELYFKFHPKQSVQNIFKNLIGLMNQEETKKFAQKLFSKKIVLGKSKPLFNVNIDQLIGTFVRCESAWEKLRLCGLQPWFELVRVWNKQVNPNSKDTPLSYDVLSDRYNDNKKILLETAIYYNGVTNDLKKAEDILLLLLKKKKRNLPALNELGRLYASQGREEEAERTFQRALEVDGSHLPVLNELGRLYASQGKEEEAERIFQRALEVDGSHLPVLNELGRLYASQGKEEEAERIFQRALEVDGSHLPVLNELGRLYASQGKEEEAERTFQRALEEDGSNLPALNELGRLYASQGKEEEAERIFQRALEVDGSNLPVLNELGRLYASQGKEEEAERIFQRALEVDGSHLPVLNELGKLYKKQNKDILALQMFEQIVSESPNDIISLYEAAKIYKKMEKVDESIKYYKKILDISPTDSRAVVGLFYCYYDYGNMEKACEIVNNHTGLQNNKYYQRCRFLCEEWYKKKNIKRISQGNKDKGYTPDGN